MNQVTGIVSGNCGQIRVLFRQQYVTHSVAATNYNTCAGTESFYCGRHMHEIIFIFLLSDPVHPRLPYTCAHL